MFARLSPRGTTQRPEAGRRSQPQQRRATDTRHTQRAVMSLNIETLYLMITSVSKELLCFRIYLPVVGV